MFLKARKIMKVLCDVSKVITPMLMFGNLDLILTKSASSHLLHDQYGSLISGHWACHYVCVALRAEGNQGSNQPATKWWQAGFEPTQVMLLM